MELSVIFTLVLGCIYRKRVRGKIDFKIRIQKNPGIKRPQALLAPRAGRRRFRCPDPGVENGIWAEFFVRFGLLEHGAFEILSESFSAY